MTLNIDCIVMPQFWSICEIFFGDECPVYITLVGSNQTENEKASKINPGTGGGGFNDAMWFLSISGSMFLFSYGMMTMVVHNMNQDRQFKYTQRFIWTFFLIFTLYFWDYCTVFFQVSNLLSSLVVLTILFKM